jgi:ribosome-binding factor A
MSQRTDRVDELLREEIGAIVARDIADPRVGFATITDVETSPDLRHAKVWVSVIGSEADRRATIAALGRAMGYVQHELGRRLRLKRIPALHVQLDDSVERGTRVLRLLSDLEAGNPPVSQPSGETLPTPVARIRHEGDADEPSPAEPTTAPVRRRPRRGGHQGPAGRARGSTTPRTRGR